MARRASLHTWPAYRDTVRGAILHYDWPTAFDALTDAAIPIHLLHGTRDSIGDQPYIERLVGARSGVSLHTVAGADHHLAVTHAELVIECIRQSIDQPTAADPLDAVLHEHDE